MCSSVEVLKCSSTHISTTTPEHKNTLTCQHKIIMNASIEISMYPLNAEYGTPILDFIRRLNTHPEIKVQTNTMSTQIFGPFDTMMTSLTEEMKTTFEQDDTIVMVLKIVNADLK